MSVRWAAGLLVFVAFPTLPTSSFAGSWRSSRPAHDHAVEQDRKGEQDQKQEKEVQREREQLERTHREEGEAVLALADAAMAGRPVRSDFGLRWQNDWVKAQRGTFVPFTLAVEASAIRRRSALVYVRAVRRDPPDRNRDRREDDEFPVDAIFPVELNGGVDGRVQISRGFSVEPGEYDIVVVMRERVDPASPRTPALASVLKQPLSVPEFSSTELTTSSVMVAERMTVLPEAVPADRLAERPYAIGRNEIVPSVDRLFSRDQELIVVLLVYNPMVTGERQFDLKVEYHFFRKVDGTAKDNGASGEADAPPGVRARAGERYVNHTDPQRFNPALMGHAFDPRSGEPVMAGQIVPLAGFEAGEYRLAVQVADLLSGKSVARDVHFRVGS